MSLLYGGLAYAGLRVARRVEDTFVRLAAAGATIWIVGQAIVNIGAVIGLIPITRVRCRWWPAGLSSLVTTMVALGMLMRSPEGNQAPPRRLPRPAPARRLPIQAGWAWTVGGNERRRAAKAAR